MIEAAALPESTMQSVTSASSSTNRKRTCVRGTKPALVVGTLLAMVFSILIVSHCNFVTTETHVLGLFNAAQYDEEGNLLGCISIYGDEVQLDGLYKTARAFGTIAAFLSTAAFHLLLFTLTFRPSKHLWNATRVMITAATMSSMFVFAIVGSSYCSDNECRLTGIGILNIFNIFLLASIAVTLHIDTPPVRPMFTTWSDDLFTVNKDTLAVEHAGCFPEFLSHEDARRIAETNAADGAASVDFPEMEVVDGEPRLVQGSRSVFSVQPSIQESLMTTVNVQRSSCFRYMILIMITLTWALTIFSIRRCTFVLVSAKADPSKKYGMGIFTRAVYDDGDMLGCLSYPEETHEDFSGAFKASRVLGTVTSLLMSLVLVCGVLQLFTTIAKDVVWFAIRAMVSAAVVVQALVFLAFKSSTCQETELIECEIGGAGMITIVNCLLLLGLAVLSCAVPPPANPLYARWRFAKEAEFAEHETTEDQRHVYLESSPMKPKLSAVQESEEVDPDRGGGSDNSMERGPEIITVRVEFGPHEKKTVKEIIHADGSRTVTTLIEDMLDVSDGEEDESTIASVTYHTMDDISLNLDPDTENVKIIL